jgi:hypothetical protein
MDMGVGVDVGTVVGVGVAVDDFATAVIVIGGDVFRRDASQAPRDVAQSPGTEEHEHARHDQFEARRDAGRQRHVEADDDGARHRHRGHVTETPGGPDECPLLKPPLPGHDRGHRDEVIGIARVLEPQHEAEQDGRHHRIHGLPCLDHSDILRRSPERRVCRTAAASPRWLRST